MKEMDRVMFEEVTAGAQPVLVEFQAPWCGYCRRLKPAMEKLAKELEGSILLGQVNIDLEEALADREKIEVVPTLVLYRQGKALGSIVAPGSKAQVEAFIKEALGGN